MLATLCHAVGYHSASIIRCGLYSRFPLQQVFLFEKKLPFVPPGPVPPPAGVIVGSLVVVVTVCVCICVLLAIVLCYIRKAKKCGCKGSLSSFPETDQSASSSLLHKWPVLKMVLWPYMHMSTIMLLWTKLIYGLECAAIIWTSSLFSRPFRSVSRVLGTRLMNTNNNFASRIVKLERKLV